ncbi:hypothetical protein [Candidatus Nitrosocosmicus arcticus]|uniref:Uncharacterized protein n=1 Tax=Candidatus Nitrosocosmicus arcticus TaxID=2035267 RepID=A0A557SWU3_9ARCH|nr:hypothetical protein [Candidatus Nitrosocosmicus arcticus]TVP41073.1 exported protein of unknown function [Candidatus Nitrosocosmicus arcticus]
MKRRATNILVFTLFATLLMSLSVTQTGQSIVNVSKLFPANSTILPGYINCLIDYSTKQCNECPPNCITFKTSNFIINNKDLASNLDKIYEKSLRQISIIKSADINTNHTKTAIIYLQSLLLKNNIKPSELTLITDIFNNINQTNSTTTLGKTLHAKIKELETSKDSSPIAISIVNITSKSVDLLVNSDSIVHRIQEYPDLPYDINDQKEWINNILSSTIVGCEISGLLGCLMASIVTSGIV